jgi:hypothetical protein
VKNVLFEQQEIKLGNKHYFLEYKTEVRQLCLKNAANVRVAKMYKINLEGFFLHVIAYVDVGLYVVHFRVYN